MTQNAINNTASIMAVDNITIDGNTISSTDTNGNVILAPDGTGTVSVTTAPIVPSGDRADSLGSATNSWDNVYADGLTFDDGSNIFDTYTEATSFTPAVEFGGGTTGITYTTQTGSYTRIGNLVWIFIQIVLSSKGTDTGVFTIEGLPFTPNAFSVLPVAWGLIDLAANYNTILAIAVGGTTRIDMTETGDNVARAALTDVDVSDTTDIFINGIFRTG